MGESAGHSTSAQLGAVNWQDGGGAVDGRISEGEADRRRIRLESDEFETTPTATSDLRDTIFVDFGVIKQPTTRL